MFGTRQVIVNQCWSWRFTFARGLSALLGATVFPPHCCLCGLGGTAPALDLCQWCLDALPRSVVEQDGWLSAVRFEWPVDTLIRELKYRAQTANAPVLAELLARAALNSGRPLPKLLVPVPQHPQRRRIRGLDHAAAITRHLGLRLRIPYTVRAIRRIRDTPSQTVLDRGGRMANVDGAFEIRGPRALRRLCASGHIAVVDDVATTGSTLREVRRVLCAAGLRNVELWSVARA
jgi:ComF family protein